MINSLVITNQQLAVGSQVLQEQPLLLHVPLILVPLKVKSHHVFQFLALTFQPIQFVVPPQVEDVLKLQDLHYRQLHANLTL